MRISHKKQSGFSLMETIIGVTIFTLGLSLLFEILSGIAHGQRLAMAADKISVMTVFIILCGMKTEACQQPATPGPGTVTTSTTS